jgi:serine protease AprX
MKKIFNTFFVCAVLLVFLQNSFAQTKQGKYLVIFKDKVGTSYSITKPLEFISQRAIDRRNKQGIVLTARDLPPSKTYIDELKKAGATVWYKSRWYNAALVLADSATAVKIKALPFVKGFENNGPMDLGANGKLRIKSKFDIELDTVNHGNGSVQARMLGTQNLHNIGIKGKGMMIGVLDDGFNRIDKSTVLKHLFDEKRIAGTFDFVRNLKSVYDVGGHGNLVLSTMAANTNGRFVGTAPEATYVLLRSEDAPTEKIIEEANYLFACEYADSVGVDLINTSLGYEDFDYAPYTHARADFDGDKALATKAADWAAQAGILVCVSAGNSGNSGIASPADGDSVLAIGAVDKNEIKSSFSSIGPSADGRIKPDMAAMGSSSTVSLVNASTGETLISTASGTSFSGPIFTGFAACFWQLNPQMKVLEVQAALKKLGSLSNSPNNLLGYGIPKLDKIVILAIEEPTKAEVSVYPNPTINLLNVNLPDTWANKKYDLQIFDLSGMPILSEKLLSGKLEIDVTRYNSGIYTGNILCGYEKLSFKFMKY